MVKKYDFAVFLGEDKNGFFAIAPELQGCYAQGKNQDEALKNIKDVIKLHLDDRLACGEKITQSKTASFARVEVTA